MIIEINKVNQLMVVTNKKIEAEINCQDVKEKIEIVNTTIITSLKNCIFSNKEIEVNFQNNVIENLQDNELKMLNFSDVEGQDIIKLILKKPVSSTIEKLEILNHNNFKNIGSEVKELHEEILDLEKEDHMYIRHHHVWGLYGYGTILTIGLLITIVLFGWRRKFHERKSPVENLEFEIVEVPKKILKPIRARNNSF